MSNIWICEASVLTGTNDWPRPSQPEVFLCNRKHTRSVCVHTRACHDLALHDGVFMDKLTPQRFCTRPAGLQLYTSRTLSHFLLCSHPAIHYTTQHKLGLWHRSCENLQGGTTGPDTSTLSREAELLNAVVFTLMFPMWTGLEELVSTITSS